MKCHLKTISVPKGGAPERPKHTGVAIYRNDRILWIFPGADRQGLERILWVRDRVLKDHLGKKSGEWPGHSAMWYRVHKLDTVLQEWTSLTSTDRNNTSDKSDISEAFNARARDGK